MLKVQSLLQGVKVKKQATEFSVAIENINNIIAKVEKEDISNEGLLNILRDITDGAVGISKSIFALVTKFGARSELKMWCDKNGIRIGQLEEIQDSVAVGIKVDVPSGMVAPYKDVMDAISTIYHASDITTLADNCKQTCDASLVSMSNGRKDHIEITKEKLHELSPILRDSTLSSNRLNKFFDTERTSLIKENYSRAFKSVAEMKAVRLELLKMESHVLQLTDLQKKINQADASIKLAVDFIEKTGTTELITKDYILKFAEYVRSIATVADQYANAATKQMALEHNLILSYEALQREMDGVKK